MPPGRERAGIDGADVAEGNQRQQLQPLHRPDPLAEFPDRRRVVQIPRQHDDREIEMMLDQEDRRFANLSWNLDSLERLRRQPRRPRRVGFESVDLPQSWKSSAR